MYVVLHDFSADFSSKNLKIPFFKLVNMAHDEAFQLKLNKEGLARITLVYKEKFNGSYLWIKDDLPELKSNFSEREALEYSHLKCKY